MDFPYKRSQCNISTKQTIRLKKHIMRTIEYNNFMFVRKV